jgi:hypothetical protein
VSGKIPLPGTPGRPVFNYCWGEGNERCLETDFTDSADQPSPSPSRGTGRGIKTNIREIIMQHDARELDKQKSTILGMLAVGCPREVAAHCVGWSEKRLQTELKQDEQFAHELARHEGGAELHHMKLVHKATEDVNNWRAATWWLDRRARDRRDRASKRVITPDEMTEFIEGLVRTIITHVTVEADRERLANILLSTVNEEDRGNMAELLRQMGLEAPKEIRR